MATLIDRIAAEIQTDDEDRAKESRRLAKTYREASHAARVKIDECFVSLCGWSLGTLIRMRAEGY